MEFCKRIILFLLLSCPLFALDQEVSSRILYYLQCGLTDQAIQTYKDNTGGTHDCEIVQAIALNILKEGFNSRDPENQLLAIFGAGISLNEKLLWLLEQGLNSPSPDIQLAALNFLSHYQNDQADRAINNAMASDFLITRLEAALILAEKKHPAVVDQTEALMHKLPKQIHPLFPQLFALIGTADAMKVLKKMLYSPHDEVRIEAIRSIAKEGRDDLIEKIRKLATQHNIAQQEVCAFALGAFKDEYSAPQLEKLARGNTPSIRLAALNSLWILGRKEVAKEIEEMAKRNDLCAIHLLGHIPDAQNTLDGLSKSPNLQVRCNASIALLQQQDPRCLPGLCELLLKDSKDLGLSRISSLGGTLSAYKIIPSAEEHFKEDPVAKELSLHLKENLLKTAVALPESDFLNLACTIFESRQSELIPTLVHLLERLQTPGAVEMLKNYQQKAGAPLIRNYCNLALYRLKEPGPYLDNLKKWVAQEQTNDLIRFRKIVPRKSNDIAALHQLTPEETSLLLVEAFEALALMQEKASLDILLDALLTGNKKNKYALAGLLIRAAQ